ncbi:hypothetical protein [Azospirillum sp. TSO22-1]|nr:hypothetical protein [Azospirillum sp. TSO22-1]
MQRCTKQLGALDAALDEAGRDALAALQARIDALLAFKDSPVR